MNVFGCTREGDYAGGIILVAANSLEEALEVYRNDSDYDWQWVEYEESNIDFRYYQPERWKEYPQLEYKSDKPCVILEEAYSE